VYSLLKCAVATEAIVLCRRRVLNARQSCGVAYRLGSFQTAMAV
jgi:hypothetical protein